jgi:hypothetical protein
MEVFCGAPLQAVLWGDSLGGGDDRLGGSGVLDMREAQADIEELRDRTKMKEYTTEAKQGMRVYLVSGSSTLPAIIMNDDSKAQLVSIDAVGREHLKMAFPCSRFTIIEARVWNGNWAGPAGATYACDVIWDYYEIEKLSDLTIHSITKRRRPRKC